MIKIRNNLNKLEEIIEYCYEMDMIRKSIFDEIINIIEKLKDLTKKEKIMKNNILNKDIVLVGFQTHEHSLYKKIKKELEGLDFEQSIEKLERLTFGFKPFYKNENTYQDLKDGKERYFYIIKIENNEEEHE